MIEERAEKRYIEMEKERRAYELELENKRMEMETQSNERMMTIFAILLHFIHPSPPMTQSEV